MRLFSYFCGGQALHKCFGVLACFDVSCSILLEKQYLSLPGHNMFLHSPSLTALPSTPLCPVTSYPPRRGRDTGPGTSLCFHAGCLKRTLWRDLKYSHDLPVILSTPSQLLWETKDMHYKRSHSSGVGKDCSLSNHIIVQHSQGAQGHELIEDPVGQCLQPIAVE